MIAPGYYRHDPPEPLGRYVDHFWILEQFPTEAAQRLVPDGTVELIFNLGVTQRLYELDDASRFRPFKDYWLSGPRRSSIIIGSPAPASMVGVHFRPFGAYAFLHEPMREFADRVLDLDSVWARDARRIRERLGYADTASERFQILTDELLARWKPDVRDEEIVRHVVGTIASPNMNCEWACDRTLRRRFDELVGLSPKTMERVLRFQRIVQRIEQPGPINWSAIAQAEGLFDQSHLVREFRDFAGLTPTEYLGRKGPYANALPGF